MIVIIIIIIPGVSKMTVSESESESAQGADLYKIQTLHWGFSFRFVL